MQLYGVGGRVFRCLWMLEEAELEYERVPIDWSKGESRTEEYLALNPNGKVPLLIDGDTRLFEALAINYYLARRYAPKLWAADAYQEALAMQWLAWGMGELEGPHDSANRSKSAIDQERFQVSLNALKQCLTQQPFLLGDSFSVVDLNTSCLLLRPQYQPITKEDTELAVWFDACTSRPALAKATQSS